MKIIEFPKFKNYNGQKVNFMQPKLDGHLAKVHKTGFGDIYAWTKNDKNITKKLLAIDHIRAELNNLPNDSIIFAELHCSDRFSTDVPTMLNNADENLQLTVFAAPLLDGYEIFNKNLTDVMFTIRDLGLDATHAEEISRGYAPPEVIKILLQKAIDRKWEGWVLKEAHMTGWYKLKPVKTIDAFVIGTQQSWSATHYGGLQSISIAVREELGKIISLGQVGSGFTLEYRKQFDTKEKRNLLVGKVCEVKFDSIAANGKLRFPRFVRWRDDKDVEQCTINQLEN